ncbi:hypothetical protein Peur_008017 [Populus x canadensis]
MTYISIKVTSSTADGACTMNFHLNKSWTYRCKSSGNFYNIACKTDTSKSLTFPYQPYPTKQSDSQKAAVIDFGRTHRLQASKIQSSTAMASLPRDTQFHGKQAHFE